jgi:hypothetical protein
MTQMRFEGRSHGSANIRLSRWKSSTASGANTMAKRILTFWPNHSRNFKTVQTNADATRTEFGASLWPSFKASMNLLSSSASVAAPWMPRAR